ncbi:hypothetical protein B0H13DRAFT_1070432 [Mycena leptocephala]|nr:hypothetical protein B0H13DRAFT_1070432 [Mycena leptocephala]
MPPPPRPPSIHSWWSDSNKPGATIPLHPMASRLSKLLYHRQVIGVIKPILSLNSSSMPSCRISRACTIILHRAHNHTSTRSKLLWNSTKILILKEILITSKIGSGAQAVVRTELPHVLVGLLQCEDAGILELTCSVLEVIFSGSWPIPGAYELSPPSIYMDLAQSLLFLLRHQTKAVCLSAIRALNEITCTKKARARFEDALAIDTVLPALVETMNAIPDELFRISLLLLGNICSSLDTNGIAAILPYLESQHVSIQSKRGYCPFSTDSSSHAIWMAFNRGRKICIDGYAMYSATSPAVILQSVRRTRVDPRCHPTRLKSMMQLRHLSVC